MLSFSVHTLKAFPYRQLLLQITEKFEWGIGVFFWSDGPVNAVKLFSIVG